MTEDRNSNKVSISATITDSSLSVSAKSRAVSAIDRLLGGFLGIPAAWLERVEERIRDQTDRDSMIQQAAANRMETAIENDQEISAVVADIALSSRLKPIANKIRVAELAVDELSGNATGLDGPTNGDDGGQVDQDWLNHFASFAERASSEDVRHLWAKVLAGEIRRTSSFSLSSLRLLSELDQPMATTFQQAVQYRCNNEFILKPKIEELQGTRLSAMSFLEEVGLIQSINAIGGISKTLNPNSDGIASIHEQDLVLVMETTKKAELPIIPLTRSGREIASILPPVNPLATLELIGKEIMDQMESVVIRKVLKRTEKQYIAAEPPVKIIKARK